ncbi:MAG TPA: M14 family zinc carboxypeptidase [Candidatus Aminicenantes bacterium]|nr:M14 family zinc carboxypeptidase [Candidatus Aminicenantes bacterium]HRY65583.1 M14 family zinc carboxypeptidase [Candidatus Aminicenantes bacterium]HRZ72529.1 M14 family zinc carboxypeptidase [Candidatus Aminicenantes bacterium]
MTKPRLHVGSKLPILITALASIAILSAALAQPPAGPASAVKARTVTAAQADQAKNPYTPDTPEPGSVEAIARFTTEPRFGNPWVAYLPDSATVPSPAEYLGHAVGAAGELSSTSKIYGYFRKLAETSPRVRVETIGRTEEGRDILLAVVADETGIRDLDRLKEATAALADPRKTTPEAAEALIASARPIYYFNAGLHSTELGSPEMVMELSYRLAVSEQPMIRSIRESLLVLINPVSEPDGRDKQVDWFYRYLKGRTDIDNLPPESPPYWGHYVFHDNNRDSHQEALQLSKAVSRMFFAYHPQVVHDLHESIPLLQTWNGTGPFNTNLDPILLNEWFAMSLAEIGALTSAGMPGVWTWGFSDGWEHVFLDSIGVNLNSIGRGYETFGNGTAETVERVLRPNEERYAGRPVTSQEWYRPLPPPRKLLWSLRNNTNYMESACLAALDYTAKNAREMLRDFYRKGRNSWQKGVKGGPYAFAIPAEQGDRRRVADMVDLLMRHGIEVGRAVAPFKVAEGEFPAGTYVVRLDQPYRNYAVDLLTPQNFPQDATYEPYDDVSWALPVHYGLEARRIDDAGIMNAAGVALEALKPGFATAGTVSVPAGNAGAAAGMEPVFLLKDTGQEGLMALRARLAAFRVEIAEKPFQSGGKDYPAGSWIMPGQNGLGDAVRKAAEELALDFDGAAAVPDVARHESKLPRLAVWHSWADTEATGWVRFVLDREKVPYAYIRDEDVRAGRLRDRFDVIIYGHNYLDLQGQILGIDKKWGPLAYKKTKETPNLGRPDASDDITGGIGWAGMSKLEEFLGAGGVLVTLGNGSAIALQGGLVRDVDRRGGAVFTPGSELRAKFVRPGHPLAYGYGETTSVFRSMMPVYDVARSIRGTVVLQWGTKLRAEDREEEKPGETMSEDAVKAKEAGAAGPAAAAKKDEPKMLVSGTIKGEDELEGRPAVLDLPAGKGRVVAFLFNPIHRDLNRSDHRLLWNALLNWSALNN